METKKMSAERVSRASSHSQQFQFDGSNAGQWTNYIHWEEPKLSKNYEKKKKHRECRQNKQEYRTEVQCPPYGEIGGDNSAPQEILTAASIGWEASRISSSAKSISWSFTFFSPLFYILFDKE